MPQSDLLIAESHLELEEKVRQRAHEIWLSHGDAGRDTALDDWLEAEREILGGSRRADVQSRATTVGDAHRPDRLPMQGSGKP
jgi:hypothetical protein